MRCLGPTELNALRIELETAWSVIAARAGRCSGVEQEHSLLKAKVMVSTIEVGSVA